MSDDDVDDEGWSEPLVQVDQRFLAPDVLAVVAFVTALASFLGFGLLNGSLYVLTFARGFSEGRLVAASVLGAAFALVPVWLGWRTNARLLDDDPAWIGTACRAAVVLGLASLVLRLVIAVAQAMQDVPGRFPQL